MRAGSDVDPKIDPPQALPAQLVGIEINVARASRLRVVLRVLGHPLEHDFVFTVAVEIADAAVVGVVGVAFAWGFAGGRARCHPRGGDVEGNAQVVLGPHRGVAGVRSLHAGDHGAHGIGRTGRALRVEIVRAVGNPGDPAAVAVQVVADAVRALRVVFVSEHAPADIHATFDLHRHHAAGERFHLVMAGLGSAHVLAERGHGVEAL